MTQKKKLALPRFEVLLIGVFFLSFLIWALSKCSSTRRQMQAATEQQAIEQAEYEASIEAAKQTVKKDSTPPKPVFRRTQERYTPLYITIDGMNVRSEPSLNAKIVDRLKLFDEVQFLNEVTDFKQEVDLGDEITNEPWIKVRTEKKRVGWVYGAGVNYYKTKRPGVE